MYYNPCLRREASQMINSYYKESVLPIYKSTPNVCCNTAQCVPAHPLPYPAILRCGTGGGISVPPITDACSQSTFPLASVTTDTTCLCDPAVIIEFSSIISSLIPAESEVAIRLVFQLSRTFDGVKVPLNTWFYNNAVNSSDPLNPEFADAFSFTFCDKSCPGCYTYTIEIISPQVLTVGTINAANVLVSNAVMTALAIGYAG